MGLAGAGLALSALGTGASVYGQSKARKSAKRAQAANAKQDAWSNLQNVVAGGSGIRRTPVEPLPQVNWGGALANIGSLLGQKHEADLAADRAEWDRAFKAGELATKTPEDSAIVMPGESFIKGVKKPTATASKLPTYQQAAKLLYGNDVDAQTQMMNALLVSQGKNPLPAGSTQLPPEAREFLMALYPSLKGGGPGAGGADPLGLGSK